MSLEVHTVSPSAAHTHTIIFLHGRDSTAEEFASELFESQASDGRTFYQIFPQLKWVFPCSKVRPCERFGNNMCQWFDMWSVEKPEERPELQTAGLCESASSILDVICKEALEVSLDRIILAGISQGCATAIHTLLAGNIQLGGFIGLSGWLPCYTETVTRTALLDKATCTPVFLSHSEDDEVVPIENGYRLINELTKLQMSFGWSVYVDGGHWVNEPMGVDNIAFSISSFLKST